MSGSSINRGNVTTRSYGVSELLTGLQRTLESEYGSIWVEGEITSWKRHRSGHCYFTLSDADGQLDCVLWRHHARSLFFKPREGMDVAARGTVSIYQARGQLQLVAQTLKMAGEGALQQAFEELKKQLDAEGLFDKRHKQPLPRIPETIGVVTAGDSAAFSDIRTTLARRFPVVRVRLASVRVQGMEAADEIAAAIRGFSALRTGHPDRPDLLIIGRGGGAAEDLWAFNEEVVARALFASTIPTISAVGHESDLSIADLVADYRAATPTMAAEVAVPHREEIANHLRSVARTLRTATAQRVERMKHRILSLLQSRAFARPERLIESHRTRVRHLAQRAERAAKLTIERHTHRATLLSERLQALHPEGPLKRGYAIVERGEERISKGAELSSGDSLSLRFDDTTRHATVDEE